MSAHQMSRPDLMRLPRIQPGCAGPAWTRLVPGMLGPEKITVSGLSRGQLEALAERLLAENAALKQAIAKLREGVAKLKGVSGRPKMKPSGMEKGVGSEPPGKGGPRGGKGRKTERLAVHEERVIKAPSRPAPGSRATRTSSSRISCYARTSSASAASAG
jgi:hypothetical protein